MSELGSRLMGVIPPMHDLAKMAGLELPEYLGRATRQEERVADPSTTETTEEKTRLDKA